ncbi:MAG: hypothetical protein P8Y48_16945 [Novosphingobium sp.]
MSNKDLDYLKSSVVGFGEIDETADAFHGKPEDPHYSVTETIWFEVLIPNSNMVAHFYIYMRPNLGICAAGAWMFRGFAATPFQMDHFNYQAALPFPQFEGDVVTVPQIGLRVKVIEPLKKVEFSYNPPNHDVSAEITATAAMPPVMRANEKHFNQFMRYQGEIKLNGETIAVDSLSMRDRSWHEQRVEDTMLAPITGWISGITLDASAAFNLVGHDDPSKGVEWEGVYPITPEKALYDGWYYKDGELMKVVSMSKQSQRDPANHMAPSEVHAEFTDAGGGKHELHGKTVAASWMSNWPNIHVWLPLMEWELDGQKAQGDCQEYCWPDYARRYFR